MFQMGRLQSDALPSGLQIDCKQSELAKEQEHLVELQRQEAAAREAQQGVQEELAKQVGLRTHRQRRVCQYCRGAVLWLRSASSVQVVQQR